jgi:hypothetical protein
VIEASLHLGSVDFDLDLVELWRSCTGPATIPE